MLGKLLFITSRYGGLPQGLINSLKRMKTDYLETPIWNMEEAYNTFHPSVIIFFHHFLKEWTEEEPKRIQALGCHKIYWDWEMPWEFDYLVQYHYLFGYILVQDRSAASHLANHINNKVIFVPHAADRESCKRLDIVPFKYRSDLCFIGSAYPSRQRFFRAVLPFLKKYKVVLAGPGYEFMPDLAGQELLTNAIGEDYILYTNGAKIVLNLHRESLELTQANKNSVPASSPNNRVFEVNAMGSFQMVDSLRMPELKEYYPSIITFENPQDFIQKFSIWIKDDDGRQQIAQANYERTLQFHAYENRFSEIISNLI